jgi:polyisoprenoid-binding protein YceI
MPGECEVPYTISASDDSTIAIEVFKTRLMRKRKHLLFFQNFSGHFLHSAERPENSQLNLIIDAKSVVCRDKWLKARQQRRITEYARNLALTADRHPEIHFSSSRVTTKPLRGFTVEGVLNVCGVTRVLKLNLVLSPRSNARLQLDADASIRLTDFGITPPSSRFGLVGTKDEALIHLLLWAKAPAN